MSWGWTPIWTTSRHSAWENTPISRSATPPALCRKTRRARTLQAVKEGMLGYTQPGGSVYNAFRSCVVSAGAKTGTSQLGGDQTENGVFVCFAPYDDPEIAVAIVIEHATWGANVASTGVEQNPPLYARRPGGAGAGPGGARR